MYVALDEGVWYDVRNVMSVHLECNVRKDSVGEMVFQYLCHIWQKYWNTISPTESFLTLHFKCHSVCVNMYNMYVCLCICKYVCSYISHFVLLFCRTLYCVCNNIRSPV